MTELYKKSTDLNFNFAENFDARKNCERNGKCAISFSDSYETGSELDAMSHKQRNQANARERYRTHRYWFFNFWLMTCLHTQRIAVMEIWRESCLICQSSLFSVNSAFNTLRLLIPTEPKNRKLSKIETLRLAKSYISHLSATLTIGKEKCLETLCTRMIYCLRRKLHVPTTVFWGVEQQGEHGQHPRRLSLQHLHILRFVGNSSTAD